MNEWVVGTQYALEKNSGRMQDNAYYYSNEDTDYECKSRRANNKDMQIALQGNEKSRVI